MKGDGVLRILKLANVYKEWNAENQGASQMDRVVARALLATNDVSTTLFITEASFDDVSRIYSTLEQVRPSVDTENIINADEELSKQEEEQFLIKDVEDSSSKKRTDRKKAVGYVISNIVKNNQGAKVVKVRYSTMEVQLPDNRRVNVKVGLSRDYNDASYNPHSWHKEDDQNITQFDYHIYLVENGDSYRGLIFNTNELQQHLSKKSYNGHFANYYFHWNPNGSVTDERDITTPIDVTNYDVEKIQWQFK